MLQTPLGSLDIQIDRNRIDYTYFPIPVDRTCADLAGRYAIVVHFCPDQAYHTISCRIKNYRCTPDDGPHSGENLELYNFFKNGTKLSIGMEGDTGMMDGQRLETYDYDTEYLGDGVQYCILPATKTTRFVFGVAWIHEVSDENEIQTWFGADPTLTEYGKILKEIG